ncbi:SHOCT domain-containing protein [Exiguobacterium aestuarii]|uniref:SHOCT domain-containing protein n=1 Tax=Exiguobacterium aestuarii TaxID=273527 RepID=UPI001CD2800A|nr:SHOCT domain-containing protein [Exiguobacterium aestuarii]MCA0980197.1 SHOCT domain-containing protein [Exiguobacterium aestuarii]
MNNVFDFKTVGKTQVTVENGFVKIVRRGLMNRFNNGGGDKNIRISSLSGIQIKKPGLTQGYIQFVFSGSKDTTGVMDAVRDENSIMFAKKEYDLALKLRDHVEELINQPLQTQNETSSNSAADELLKLKQLLDAGVLSQEEFETQKVKLLSN